MQLQITLFPTPHSYMFRHKNPIFREYTTSSKPRAVNWITSMNFTNLVYSAQIFGPSRDEVTNEGRKRHNEELNDMYCSPNIVRVIKSRMRWTGHVARMAERRGVYRVLVGKCGDNLEDLSMDVRIILKWVFRK
jgi:hypothetical protein